MYTDADKQDAYHLLALAESGRPEEQMAQFLASMIISCDMDPIDEMLSFLVAVLARYHDLFANQDKIWYHLLPGGSQGGPLLHPDTEHLHAIIDIVGQDTTDKSVLASLDSYFRDNRLVTERSELFPIGSDCLVVAVEDGGWILATSRPTNDGGPPLCLWKYNEVAFTNISNPDGDEVEPGDQIRVHPDDLIPLDWSELGRHQRKAWQDKRPGWTRRVRWYEGQYDIRLEFIDEFGLVNRYFGKPENAQVMYDKFKDGEVSTLDLR